MKSSRNSRAKKGLRVATTLLGASGTTVALMPAAPAFAGPVPNQPYELNIIFKLSVSQYHVCGWHPGNAWRCTTEHFTAHRNGSTVNFASDVGGNGRSWDRGTLDVYWNSGGPGHRDTCNTNGTGNWALESANSVWLWNGSFGNGIGNGVPTC
jgi:hypothetical protein